MKSAKVKNISIFCFGFGQVAKNFIKKLSIEKYNINLSTTSRDKSSKKIFNHDGIRILQGNPIIKFHKLYIE